MLLAQIGPLTTMLEAFAAAVGAGAVIGSVAVGVCGLWARRSIQDIELLALSGGYVGGAGGGVLALIDAVISYGIAK
jgi:hypothetical protein